jgi:hypothetical protein
MLPLFEEPLRPTLVFDERERERGIGRYKNTAYYMCDRAQLIRSLWQISRIIYYMINWYSVWSWCSALPARVERE